MQSSFALTFKSDVMFPKDHFFLELLYSQKPKPKLLLRL